MDVRGLPDWHRPVRVGAATAYAAFERPGRLWLPPTRWEAAGEEPWLIELFRSDLGSRLSSFAIMNMRFRVADELAEVQRARPDLLASSMVAATGWLRLAAPEIAALPPAVRGPHLLAPGTLEAPGVTLRLDAVAADVIVASLRTGLSPITGQVTVVVEGMAARSPVTVRIHTSTLIDHLGSEPITVPELRNRLIGVPPGLTVVVGSPTADPTAYGWAVCDRLIARCGTFAPPEPGDADARVRFTDPAAELIMDLSDPVPAPRAWVLAADPLGPLRTLPPTAQQEQILRVHTVPALGSGWHRLAFSPLVRDRLFGVARQSVEVRAAPHLPGRPQTARTAVALAGSATVTADLRLGPGEALDYCWNTSTVLDGGGQPMSITSTPEPRSDTWTALPLPEDQVRVMRVEATADLLATDTVQVHISALVEGDAWTVVADLDPRCPRGTAVLPGDAVDPAVVIIARTADGRERRAEVGFAGRLRIDPFSFPRVGTA